MGKKLVGWTFIIIFLTVVAALITLVDGWGIVAVLAFMIGMAAMLIAGGSLVTS